MVKAEFKSGENIISCTKLDTKSMETVHIAAKNCYFVSDTKGKWCVVNKYTDKILGTTDLNGVVKYNAMRTCTFCKYKADGTCNKVQEHYVCDDFEEKPIYDNDEEHEE